MLTSLALLTTLSKKLQDVEVELLGIFYTGVRNSTMLMSNSLTLLALRS
jgi:hypothetical protein